MIKFARIESGIVRELIESDDFPEFHESIEIVDVTSITGVQEGWIKSAATFIAAPLSPVDPQIAVDARLARLRTVREEILNRLGGIAGRAARQGDNATADACDIAVQGLLDITKDLPAELDTIELEVVSRYKAIVTTAAITAPSLISAFAGVDL